MKNVVVITYLIYFRTENFSTKSDQLVFELKRIPYKREDQSEDRGIRQDNSESLSPSFVSVK